MTAEQVERVREESKLLFGSSLRLEVAAAIASSADALVWGRQLAQDLGINDNQAAGELGKLARIGLLTKLPRNRGNRLILYRRVEDPFWEAVLRRYEHALRGGTQDRGSVRGSVAVIGGAGYVGLVTATDLASLGHSVWCMDANGDKLAHLAKGRAPFYEPGLDDALRRVMRGEGHIHFTTSSAEALANARFVMITADFPTFGDESPHAQDRVAIRAWIEQLVAAGLDQRHVLVMKSTVPCGTGTFVKHVLGELLPDVEVPYLSCPEFLKEGTALADVRRPDRIVIGDSGQAAGAELESLLHGVNYRALVRMRIESAELVKLASNAWLATQISFVNGLANLCDAHRPPADVIEVTERLSGPLVPAASLRPGIGFGGPFLPNDVVRLRRVAFDLNRSFPLLDEVMRTNQAQPARAIAKIRQRITGGQGKTVAVLGLAYKNGTSDTRGSQSVPLIEELVQQGYLVRTYDPCARGFDVAPIALPPHSGLTTVDSITECLDGADGVIVATDWSEFANIDWQRHASTLAVVVDGRNMLPVASVLAAGIAYDGIGRRIAGTAESGLAPDEVDVLAGEAADALLAIKASFMAEVEALTAGVDADWEEVAFGIALDSRIGRECLLERHRSEHELEGALQALEDRASAAQFRFPLLAATQETRTTVHLVADQIPDVADLGIRRPPDRGRREHAYALRHPDLREVPHGVRSLEAPPNNLPNEPTAFVGREDELAEVRSLLESTRLMTLTGAGGCGKTRLALQTAADAVTRFRDGAWWVELAPITDGELVPQALSDALGVRTLPTQDALEVVCAHLAEREALVVLDNCEHLLEAAAGAAEALLAGCPGTTVLVTSRAVLGLARETAWRVPSLSLPDAYTVHGLGRSDAVRLLLARAREVAPDFAVSDENAPAIARICEDLEGIPLAIELAAPQLRLLSPEQLSARLGDRFLLLTAGRRNALDRHRTLRASMDWSHDLLEAEERTLFRRLAVFTGPFTIEDAVAVGADDGEDGAVLDVLASLVGKSLVVAEHECGAVRYRLLEAVREYAYDRLREAHELDAVRNRHRDLVLTLAEAAAPSLSGT